MFRYNEISHLSREELVYLAESNDIPVTDDMAVEEIIDLLAPVKELKLAPYQMQHGYRMLNCLDHHNVVLDTSDTGCGKTYTTTGIVLELNRPVFVIAPAPVLYPWYDVFTQYGIDFISISSYEVLRASGKYYIQDKGFNTNGVECPYITKIGTTFKSNFPAGTIVVIDEAHRARNDGTLTANLISCVCDQALNKGDIKVILLTATPVEQKATVKTMLKYLGLPNNIGMEKVYETLYKGESPYASRMTMAERDAATGISLDNNVKAKAYLIDGITAWEIEKQNAKLRALVEGESAPCTLKLITELRKKVELYKCPLIVEKAEKYHNRGQRVAIFLNFKDSVQYIKGMLGEHRCAVIEGQTATERAEQVHAFQGGDVPFILVIIKSGGTGISLHDIVGDSPRVSLISPPLSATDLLQTLGRVHRAGSKSNSKQRIILTTSGDGETIEERIANNLNVKLSMIAAFNTGDINGTLFQFDSSSSAPPTD